MAVATTYEALAERLRHVVPEAELRLKMEWIEEIRELKRRRNAVILGHNYMEPALFHSVPDFTGDSLELCRRAMEADAEVLVFCGVRFMAETAKILNPERTVLLPSLEAGCSLADSIRAADVRGLRARFSRAPVVAYINSPAEVKAEADVCCTSGNAAAVVESLDAPTVIFVPDEFLARNVALETGRRIVFADPARESVAAADGSAGRIAAWTGRCEVHEKFTVEDVSAVRRQFPDVLVLAHPECSPEVVAAADFAGSTAAMIRRVEQSDAPCYLLLTECAMGDNIAAANPDKEMLRLCSVRCPHMSSITLEETRNALRDLRHEIDVPVETAARARRALERMIAVA